MESWDYTYTAVQETFESGQENSSNKNDNYRSKRQRQHYYRHRKTSNHKDNCSPLLHGMYKSLLNIENYSCNTIVDLLEDIVCLLEDIADAVDCKDDKTNSD